MSNDKSSIERYIPLAVIIILVIVICPLVFVMLNKPSDGQSSDGARAIIALLA